MSGFVRELGLFDSVLLVVGTVIGSGIFLVSADIGRQVGSAGWLLVVWILGGALTLIAALTYGELAAMMPQTGGQYVYLREAYGPLVGFLYGWTLFLVIQTGSIAAVAVAFATFLGVIEPWVSTQHLLLTSPIAISTRQVVAVSLIALLTAVNMRGVRAGKWVQNIFTLAKIAALAGLIALGFVAKRAAPLEGAWALVAQGRHVSLVEFLPILGIAMVGSLFAYDAWNNITFTADEVKQPSRTIPLGLGLGVSLVTAIYILVNVTYLLSLSIGGIQRAPEDRVATAVTEAVLGSHAGVLMAAAILLATVGSDNGMILAGSRVYHAMARDGLFFRSVANLNPHGVPAASLVLQALWASVLTLSGTYSNLVDYVIFAALLFYVLTVGAVFRLRRRYPNAKRPYRAFGYPVAPLIYLGSTVLIMAALLAKKPQFTGRGLAIVILGLPVYAIWKRARVARPR